MIDPETIPECALQRLGAELADLLDEDHWNNVEKRYLLPALEEQEDLRARVAEMEALLLAADRAIGDHNAPSDCYSTGPMTGDPIQDLVVCPACTYLKARKG